MTFREQCALAILKATGRVRDEIRDGRSTSAFFLPPTDYIVSKSGEIADAMEAERKRRDQAEAPDAPMKERLAFEAAANRDAELAAARREGRDAGLREVCQALQSDLHRTTTLEIYRKGLSAAIATVCDLMPKAPSTAPDIDALASETAKLRAVAEAAAAVQRGRHQDGLNDGPITARLTDALDAALPSWRTK